MFLNPFAEDDETPPLTLKKTIPYVQPYGDRAKFHITFTRNSEHCGGVFYSKEKEQVKYTHFYHLKTTSLLGCLSQGLELPCVRLYRGLGELDSVIVTESKQFGLCLKQGFFLMKRTSFLKGVKEKRFVFRSGLGLKFVKLVKQAGGLKGDFLVLVGNEDMWDNNCSFVLFDVRRRRRLLSFRPEDSNFVWRMFECGDLLGVGAIACTKNREFGVVRVDLVGRCSCVLAKVKKSNFSRVSFCGFLRVLDGLCGFGRRGGGFWMFFSRVFVLFESFFGILNFCNLTFF